MDECSRPASGSSRNWLLGKSKALRRILLAGVFFILGQAQADAARDAVLVCTSCGRLHMKAILSEADRLEKHYAQYRWFQSRLRRLYYEDLWAARRDQLDPLSKNARVSGNAREEFITADIEDLETKSRLSENRFHQKLVGLQQGHLLFSGCCRERAYGECIEQSFRPVYDKLQEMRRLFDLVLEHEREQLKAVRLSAGDKGLYLGDTVESGEQHGEYYERMEREKEADRFSEDEKMRRFFTDLRSILTRNFPADDCCLKYADEPREEEALAS